MHTKALLLVTTALVSLLLSTAARAQVVFEIVLDTSSLIGRAEGPFSLDFQFIDGEGIGNNNNWVVLSGFDFEGGHWNGAEPGTVSLEDTSFFSEFIQGFTAGNVLRFVLEASNNPNTSPIPDRFSFAILDRDLFEIPTTGPADALAAVDLGPSPVAWAFPTDLGATSILLPPPSVTAIPEVPQGAVAIGSALCAAALARRAFLKRRRRG